MASPWIEYAAVVAVAVGAYCWLVLVLRVSGKRSLSKLNAFDFAITVAFGSALATVIVSRDVGLFRGALVLAMLALLQYAVSRLSLQWPWFHDAVRSKPTLLLEDGGPVEKALRHERITLSELDEAVRSKGYARLDQLAAVVLETDGSFSVIPKEHGQVELLRGVRRMNEAHGAENEESRA